IVKVKETKIQHNLSQLQRIENLQGAFELNADLSEKKILVLDDIVTTKNTLREIKKTLNENYADLKFVAVSSRSNEKY
ncbi:MAG: ComF family protein, partial [Finegoldia magna]|nr:ComF family protein [Finegoldia magna]